MKAVYEENPALGDPNSLDKQLAENGDKLDKLRLEQQKFQVLDNCINQNYLSVKVSMENSFGKFLVTPFFYNEEGEVRNIYT